MHGWESVISNLTAAAGNNADMNANYHLRQQNRYTTSTNLKLDDVVDEVSGHGLALHLVDDHLTVDQRLLDRLVRLLPLPEGQGRHVEDRVVAVNHVDFAQALYQHHVPVSVQQISADGCNTSSAMLPISI